MMAIRPAKDFDVAIGMAGFSRESLAREAGLSVSTVHGIVNPEWQPQRTKKTVRPRTAGLIAAAYARTQGISPEDAFKRLFVQDEQAPA